MVSPRERALDAAIDLTGTQGLRALTHHRVDDHAGLPRGSASNYFRTRDALLTATLERIATLEQAQITPAAPPATPAQLTELLAATIEHLTGPGRTTTTARLVLFMEASHNPRLRDAIQTARHRMEAAAITMLAHLGAPDPATAATAVMACCEGLTLHRIGRHDTTDPRPALTLTITAALTTRG
ncbi:TetR/AcrR family transcriptional regulator [Longispora albida]|uniref:TetR/AcrR family transcriptional regulator n=1 Tax=Longispora albida TaxID=203523 RepID=UPI000374E5E6|nr:TetR family transcriptional regulator C-terminal domain-containing protein [Longispora albida]